MDLTGSTILITGGTGSFGHRIARSLLTYSPAEIRIYSRDEKKQWEMQRAIPELRFIIGDVRDRRRLDGAMRGVDFVFHAAALKQVPSCEVAPAEAVMTQRERGLEWTLMTDGSGSIELARTVGGEIYVLSLIHI